MLSKSQISFVKSLQQKKNRKESSLFVVEGIKSVVEFAQSDYVIDTIFYTGKDVLKLLILSQNVKLFEIKEEELKKISMLMQPQQLLALVRIPKYDAIQSFQSTENNFTFLLDNIQDPGNLGTIIRTADWFGFKQLICSNDTVDVYNPKVIQASMGSLARMQVAYTDLPSFLQGRTLPVYGALLNGQDVSTVKFPKAGLLVLGNEGSGISEEVRKYIQYPVTIPRFGQAESLNVAISAAIFCAKIKKI